MCSKSINSSCVSMFVPNATRKKSDRVFICEISSFWQSSTVLPVTVHYCCHQGLIPASVGMMSLGLGISHNWQVAGPQPARRDTGISDIAPLSQAKHSMTKVLVEKHNTCYWTPYGGKKIHPLKGEPLG